MKTISIPQIDGGTFDLPLDTPELEAHFANPNNYTEAIISQLRDGIYKNYITPDNKIFLDLGANVGLFTLHILPFAEIMDCVEPSKNNSKVLLDVLTNIAVPYDVWDFALFNADGEMTFSDEPVNTTMASLVKNHGDNGYTVKTKTLYSILQTVYSLDTLKREVFCKMDVEGSECRAITMEQINKCEPYIRKYWIEYHGVDGISPDTWRKEHQKLFDAAGYTTELVHHDTLYCVKL